MAAMKPRTGDGPMEVTKEGRGIVMRVPLEGGGRLVVELNAVEAAELAGALKGVASADRTIVRIRGRFVIETFQLRHQFPPRLRCDHGHTWFGDHCP